jgi:hypothetical protein
MAWKPHGDDVRKPYTMREGEPQVALHHSLGMYIRNQFGLWRGNEPLLADCASCLGHGIDGRYIHPDRASGVILAALWRRLRQEG